MKKRKSNAKKKFVFYFVALIILCIVAYTAYGIYTEKNDYMRFGIDIKGGVSATFAPKDGYQPTDDQLDSARAVIELRLDSKNILDRTLTVDRENNFILVEFPWQAGEKDFDPVAAVDELGATSQLTFMTVSEAGADAKDTVTYEGIEYVVNKKFMTGAMIDSSTPYVQDGKPIVGLKFNKEGTKVFPDSTDPGDWVAIMMDNTVISVAQISEEITNGEGVITGNFTQEEAVKLSEQINSGALPFTMEAINYSSVSATMGTNALSIMIMAGAIALVIIFLFMCIYYRLPGFVASITLLLQTAGQLLIFHSMGLTLTLPGIAGIILSIGMGVDSNIIISERIKEEINAGKTLRGAIRTGYSRAFSAVLDCNVTTGVIGILLAVFGTGSMLSFAYTLLIGIVLNFGLSIISSKLMVQSLAEHKCFSNLKLYGYKKQKEVL